MILGFRIHTNAAAVIVPEETMPGWLQPVVKINPVTILADATRGLLVGGPVARPVMGTLIWCIVLVAVFAPPGAFGVI